MRSQNEVLGYIWDSVEALLRASVLGVASGSRDRETVLAPGKIFK